MTGILHLPILESIAANALDLVVLVVYFMHNGDKICEQLPSAVSIPMAYGHREKDDTARNGD